MKVVFFSDTHIRKALYRRAVLIPGLRDVSKRIKPDLFISAGDCTDNGNEENWAAFKDVLDRHLKVDKKIITIGNHDTWTSYDLPHDYASARGNYLRYANAIMGTRFKKVYFTYETNGCSFIVMGSEGTSTGADISDEQLEWLKTELDKASEAGGPLFVINHHPMNFTHAVGNNERGAGISTEGASEKLRAILDGYKNVFYFSGHQHFGLSDGFSRLIPIDFTTVEKVGNNITSVNLPCYEYGGLGSAGYAPLGEGLVMDVSDDCVTLRGRNFLFGKWNSKVNVKIELN